MYIKWQSCYFIYLTFYLFTCCISVIVSKTDFNDAEHSFYSGNGQQIPTVLTGSSCVYLKNLFWIHPLDGFRRQCDEWLENCFTFRRLACLRKSRIQRRFSLQFGLPSSHTHNSVLCLNVCKMAATVAVYLDISWRFLYAIHNIWRKPYNSSDNLK